MDVKNALNVDAIELPLPQLASDLDNLVVIRGHYADAASRFRTPRDRPGVEQLADAFGDLVNLRVIVEGSAVLVLDVLAASREERQREEAGVSALPAAGD